MENELLLKMIGYYKGDPKRAQHFAKVYHYSVLIGEQENIGDEKLDILKAAAAVHDIGIKIAEQKYGRNNGKLQEQFGPEEAEKMLSEVGYSKEKINRICFLVGHHHTYTDIDGIDCQILVEADFLVNMFEDNLDKETIMHTYRKIFRTKTGKAICRNMFDIDINNC